MDIINEMKKTRSYKKHVKLLSELIQFTSKSKKNEKLILKIADLHLVLAKSIKICSKGMKMEGGGVFSGLIKCFGRLCGIRNGTVDVYNPLTEILNEIRKNLESLRENHIANATNSALVDTTYNLMKEYAIIFFINISNNRVQEIDNMELYSTFYIEFSEIAERISREYYRNIEDTDATQYEDGKYYEVYPIDLERFLTGLKDIPLFTEYLLCLRHSFEIIIAKDQEYDPHLIAQYTNTFLYYLNKLRGYLNTFIRRKNKDKRDINIILTEYAEKANYEDVSVLFPKLDSIEKYRLPDEADEADEADEPINLEF
jgi:hypothetical protein